METLEQQITERRTESAERLGSVIGRGRTAEVYRWGDEQAVKLFLPDVSTAGIAHEIQTASALAELSLPAPRFHGKVQIDDRIGLIFDRVDGRPMLAALSNGPWRVAA